MPIIRLEPSLYYLQDTLRRLSLHHQRFVLSRFHLWNHLFHALILTDVPPFLIHAVQQCMMVEFTPGYSAAASVAGFPLVMRNETQIANAAKFRASQSLIYAKRTDLTAFVYDFVRPVSAKTAFFAP